MRWKMFIFDGECFPLRQQLLSCYRFWEEIKNKFYEKLKHHKMSVMGDCENRNVGQAACGWRVHIYIGENKQHLVKHFFMCRKLVFNFNGNDNF